MAREVIQSHLDNLVDLSADRRLSDDGSVEAALLPSMALTIVWLLQSLPSEEVANFLQLLPSLSRLLFDARSKNDASLIDFEADENDEIGSGTYFFIGRLAP